MTIMSLLQFTKSLTPQLMRAESLVDSLTLTGRRITDHTFVARTGKQLKEPVQSKQTLLEWLAGIRVLILGLGTRTRVPFFGDSDSVH